MGCILGHIGGIDTHASNHEEREDEVELLHRAVVGEESEGSLIAELLPGNITPPELLDSEDKLAKGEKEEEEAQEPERPEVLQ